MKPAIVIGAGPAGVYAARALAERQLACRVLESAPRPLAGLRQIDPDMRLLSPARLTGLPRSVRGPGGDHMKVARLIEAFEQLIESERIGIETDTAAVEVARRGPFFAVRTSDGRELHSRFVVNTTGYVSRPVIPSEPWVDAIAVRKLHSLHVRDADLAAARRLLVVGGGTSASDVIERWLRLRSPASRAIVSARSRIQQIPRRILGLDSHYWAFLPELLPIGCRAGRRLIRHESAVGTAIREGGRRGLVRVAGPVVSTRGDEVVLSGDAVGERPDLVVFATGYRYAADHLPESALFRDRSGEPVVRGCESSRWPGLFLLGLRFSRTLASPYLRGMARDARYVARRIAQRGAA